MKIISKVFLFGIILGSLFSLGACRKDKDEEVTPTPNVPVDNPTVEVTLTPEGTPTPVEPSTSTPTETIETVTKYKVTILDSENGVVSADKNEVNAGQFIIFTISPNEGYEVLEFFVNDNPVSVIDNAYTLFDVRSDVAVKATFKTSPIKVSYYDETGTKLLYQKTSNNIPCEIPFGNNIPTTTIDQDYYYLFEGWYTEKDGGDLVTDFTFTKSTNLYAHFTKHEYKIDYDESLVLDVFDTKQLNVTSTLPETYEVTYKSTDKSILDVTRDGLIKTYADGKADVIIGIAGAEYICNVTVKTIESSLQAKYVYGAGYVKYVGKTGIIYSSQATIVDQNNNAIKYEYIDYSVDIYMENTATGNFGLVFNKVVDSAGLATSFYQFNFEVGKSNNVKLIKDKVDVAGTKTTYNLEVGKAYNFRVLTSPSENNKVKVMCFIDGNLVIETIVAKPSANGLECGLRMADAVTNRFANIKLTNNVCKYKVSVGNVLNGSLSVDKTEVEVGGSLLVSCTPDEGYYLSSLSINNDDVTDLVVNNQYTLNNISNDVVVEVVFAKYHTITYDECINGSVTLSQSLAKAGESVTIIVSPDSGYKLDTLKVNGVDVSLVGNKYVISNVDQDITILATFKEKESNLVVVDFYLDNELIETKMVNPNEVVIPPTVSKNDKKMIIYTFESWKDSDNNIYTEFVFDTDIQLFAYFSESYHEVTLNNTTYQLNVLESFDLTLTTTATYDYEIIWSSENETVVKVDSNGHVFAVGSGKTMVVATIDGVTASCEVEVKVADGYCLKGVYPNNIDSSKTYYENGVLTIGSGIQADLYDENGLAVMDCFEIELNMILGCNVGSGAVFGFQLNKLEKADCSVDTCYMVKPMTSANMQFTKNDSVIAGAVVENKIFEANQLYRVKIVVEKVEETRNIKVYIDGTLYMDYTDENYLTGTIFGIRCKAIATSGASHKIAVVSVKK